MIQQENRLTGEFNNQSGAFILAHIGANDSTRGDSRGWTGLAREVARLLNGRFAYLDENSLRERYHVSRYAEGGDDPLDLYRRYLREEGRPDILIGDEAYVQNALRWDRTPGHTSYYTQINENLAEGLLSETSLVAHHLTPEGLRAEAAKFDAAHPDIKRGGRELIAIMLADPNITDLKDFTRKLVHMCAGFEKPATVFLCASRRTDAGTLRELHDYLSYSFRRRMPQKDIDVRSWQFRHGLPGGGTDNPYQGLIGSAGHFIVWGESRSLVSEALMSGRTVHVYKAESEYPDLAERNYVREFNAAAEAWKFATLRQEPLNLTQKLAEALVADFREMRRFRFPGPE